MITHTLFTSPNCHVCSRYKPLIDYMSMDVWGLAAYHQFYRQRGNISECLAIEDAVKQGRKDIYLLERLNGWKPISNKEFFR